MHRGATLTGQTTLRRQLSSSHFERDTVMFPWQLDIQIHPSRGKKWNGVGQGGKCYSFFDYYLTGYAALFLCGNNA